MGYKLGKAHPEAKGDSPALICIIDEGRGGGLRAGRFLIEQRTLNIA